MKRKIVSAIIICLMLSICIAPAYAAQKNDIQLMFDEINLVRASLTIDETLGIATCTGKITAKSVKPVEVYVSLQKYVNGQWVTLKTWSAAGTLTASKTGQYAIYSGYKYRVSTIGYVLNDQGIILETGTALHEVNYPSN